MRSAVLDYIKRSTKERRQKLYRIITADVSKKERLQCYGTLKESREPDMWSRILDSVESKKQLPSFFHRFCYSIPMLEPRLDPLPPGIEVMDNPGMEVMMSTGDRYKVMNMEQTARVFWDDPNFMKSYKGDLTWLSRAMYLEIEEQDRQERHNLLWHRKYAFVEYFPRIETWYESFV